MTEIFPGGRLPTIEMVEEHSAKAGFTLTRRQSLQPHYARTLDLWAEALEAHQDEAIAIQSEEIYERYMKYLTGCAELFRIGYIDVNQFTLRSSALIYRDVTELKPTRAYGAWAPRPIFH